MRDFKLESSIMGHLQKCSLWMFTYRYSRITIKTAPIHSLETDDVNTPSITNPFQNGGLDELHEQILMKKIP